MENKTATQKSFRSSDAAFRWYRSTGAREEAIVSVAGTKIRFFRDSSGLIDSEVARQCQKAGCAKGPTVVMTSGDLEYFLCERHGSEASIEHDYSFVQRIGLDTHNV